MTITDLDRRAEVSLTGPSTPRLRLQPGGPYLAPRRGLGYFASKPPDLLIAVCRSGRARVDLPTVPLGAPREIAE